MARAVCLLLCVLWWQPLLAEQSVVGGSFSEELTFHLHHGFLILVPVQIGGVSDLKFILDTGSSHTVVEKRVAQKLGIRGLPSKLLTIRQALDSVLRLRLELGLGQRQIARSCGMGLSTVHD